MSFEKAGGRKFFAFLAGFLVVTISHFTDRDAMALAMALSIPYGIYAGTNVAQKLKAKVPESEL